MWYQMGLLDPEMGVRDDPDEPINSGKVGMYFSPWWKIGYGTPDAYRNDPTANWKSYIVFTDEGKWYTREQSPRRFPLHLQQRTSPRMWPRPSSS